MIKRKKHGTIRTASVNLTLNSYKKGALIRSLNARFSVPVSAAALLTAKRYNFPPVKLKRTLWSAQFVEKPQAVQKRAGREARSPGTAGVYIIR
jgi:hypothetical protein